MDQYEVPYYGFLCIVEYEFRVRILTFKMAVVSWWPNFVLIHDFFEIAGHKFHTPVPMYIGFSHFVYHIASTVSNCAFSIRKKDLTLKIAKRYG